jgi:hypothetical protein
MPVVDYLFKEGPGGEPPPAFVAAVIFVIISFGVFLMQAGTALVRSAGVV